MFKKAVLTTLMIVGLAAVSRAALSYSEYDQDAWDYIWQGYNLALDHYEQSRPIYQGQEDKSQYYYWVYECAYAAAMYAYYAMNDNVQDYWFWASQYAQDGAEEADQLGDYYTAEALSYGAEYAWAAYENFQSTSW